MDTIISFTPAQFFTLIASACAGISSVAAVVAIFNRVIRKAKAPNAAQDKRIGDLEGRVDKIEEFLGSDLKKITALEKENRISQRALLAICESILDGNNKDAVRRSVNEIKEYLIEK